MKRLVVNLETCSMTGLCSVQFPKLFGEGDDGFPIVLVANVDDIPPDQIAEIIDTCPTGSIQVIDDEAPATR